MLCSALIVCFSIVDTYARYIEILSSMAAFVVEMSLKRTAILVLERDYLLRMKMLIRYVL
jgi:hypothetical protein